MSTSTFEVVQIFARETDDSNAMIVGLAGEFDLAAIAAVRSHLHSLLSDGWTNLILDFDEVGFIDSAGLGVLIGLHRRCRAADGMLAIARPSTDVMRLLAAAQLDAILTVRPTVADASSALVDRSVDVS